MTEQPEQLSLRFGLRPEFTFANFELGDSAEAVQRLSELPRQVGFVGLWLWGGNAVGKTHLLHATCQVHGGRVGYLPLADIDSAQALAAQEPLDLLALDDVHSWFADAARERALQAVYQAQVNHGGKLLITSRLAPSAGTAQLPDLVSRLRSLSCYELLALSDSAKERLLMARAKERGLLIAQDVTRFWLARGDRNLGSLLAQLHTLCEVALAEQRRITIPLLKRVLRF